MEMQALCSIRRVLSGASRGSRLSGGADDNRVGLGQVTPLMSLANADGPTSCSICGPGWFNLGAKMEKGETALEFTSSADHLCFIYGGAGEGQSQEINWMDP
jgi:hypothetical protein